MSIEAQDYEALLATMPPGGMLELPDGTKLWKQDEVEETTPNRDALVEFFYLLARDHLPTGVIRGIISSHLEHEVQATRVFSDSNLEAWARERAEEINAIQATVRFEGWEVVR